MRIIESLSAGDLQIPGFFFEQTDVNDLIVLWKSKNQEFLISIQGDQKPSISILRLNTVSNEHNRLTNASSGDKNDPKITISEKFSKMEKVYFNEIQFMYELEEVVREELEAENLLSNHSPGSLRQTYKNFQFSKNVLITPKTEQAVINFTVNSEWELTKNPNTMKSGDEEPIEFIRKAHSFFVFFDSINDQIRAKIIKVAVLPVCRGSDLASTYIGCSSTEETFYYHYKENNNVQAFRFVNEGWMSDWSREGGTADLHPPIKSGEIKFSYGIFAVDNKATESGPQPVFLRVGISFKTGHQVYSICDIDLLLEGRMHHVLEYESQKRVECFSTAAEIKLGSGEDFTGASDGSKGEDIGAYFGVSLGCGGTRLRFIVSLRRALASK